MVPLVVLTREDFEKVRAVVALSLTTYHLSNAPKLKDQAHSALDVLEKAYAASAATHSRKPNAKPSP